MKSLVTHSDKEWYNNMLSIVNINRHRMSTDGHGITTLVGLAGCPLRCKYCINKKALLMPSKQITTSKLLDKILIDYCYFVATNGGITFGGGEPLIQSDGIVDVINNLPPRVAVNIETSLNTLQNAVEKIIDTKFGNKINWIIDIKTIDSEIYTEYTGTNNTQVIRNLRLLASRGLQGRCIIRVPLIPNHNDDLDIEKSIKFLNKLGFYNIDKFRYIT